MTFEDVLKNKPPHLIEIARHFQKITIELHSEIIEEIYGGKKIQMALYSIGNKNNVMSGIGLGKDYCALWLHHFDKIDLKNLNLEGKGKHARHVKFKSMDEVNDKIIAEVLKSTFDITYSNK